MAKNKTLTWVIVIAILAVILWQVGIFDMFTLSPVTIDPATCTSPTLIVEKSTLSDTLAQSCYPYSWKFPSILVAYDYNGNYINAVSGDSIIWGGIHNGKSALVRCYKCASAEVVGNSPSTKVLTDDKISNPLGQSQAFSNVCQVGDCSAGWECKSNSQGTYLDYTACGGAPPKPIRFCGNGIAESGETRDNCCKDVNCGPGFDCISNQCIVQTDEPEICGNHVCAYGENHTNCPADCPDTGLFCGDAVCNNGETQSTCCTDCRCPGSYQCINNECQATTYQCGDNVCNAQETCESCPADCGVCECIEGQMEYVDCGTGWKPNIWAVQQCINRHWQPVQSGLACYCVSSSSCLPHYRCSNNICTPDLPTFCAKTSDCGISGYYCETASHKCLECTSEISECELTGYSCNSANDCFDVSNNYCASWTCNNGQCLEGSARFGGCCNNASSCGMNQTCSNGHVCEDIPTVPKKPVSLLNIIITLSIFAAVAVGGYFIYTKTKIFKK